jgi:hypothetical protein
LDWSKQATLDTQLHLMSGRDNVEREFLPKNRAKAGHKCRKHLWIFDKQFENPISIYRPHPYSIPVEKTVEEK